MFEGLTVRRIAETFHFSHGEKVVHRERLNQGVMRAWQQAWHWRDRELFIIIEDDVSMSPHWFRAAVNMWQKYGNRLNCFQEPLNVLECFLENILVGWDSRTKNSVLSLRTKAIISLIKSGD